MQPVSSLVPHTGAMCLLDAVHEFDEQSIRCRGRIALDSPLAVGDRLPATGLIEYAAQAMAAHGVLLGQRADPGARPRQGMLVGLRGVELARRWIDPVDGPLDVVATREAGDDRQVIYGFSVRASDGTLLAAGRATVVLDANETRPSS